MKKLPLLLTALLSACAPHAEIHTPGDIAQARGKDVVILVHGYYGSALVDKTTDRREFIHLPTLLYGSLKVSLHSAELGILPSPALEVEGLLKSVTIIPRLYHNDVYGSFLGKLSLPENQFPVALAYDWRGDLHGAVQNLAALVAQIKAQSPRSVSILAHSMGGLVTAYYLAYGDAPPEKAKLNWAGTESVGKVMYMGTPFGGSISILRNMQLGTGYPWNKQLLQPGTVSSFPASYHLLPLRNAVFLDAQKQPLTLPLAQEDFWDENKLGLHREDSAPAQSQARQKYTKTQLARAKLFLDLVHAKRSGTKATSNLKVINVVGAGRPTLTSGYYLGPGRFVFLPEEAKRENLPYGALESDGDGSVAASAAALPPLFSAGAKEIRSSFAHDKLFLDPKVEEEYANFLRP